MNTSTRTIRRTGLAAAALTAAAGLAELVAGSTAWTGNKNGPTTLGLVTIGLGLVMGIAAVSTMRSNSARPLLAVAAGLGVPALIALTTAGLAAIPGAVVGVTAAGLVALRVRRTSPIGPIVSDAWPAILISVLAFIYLAFGAVAGPIGLLGIAGAAAAIASFFVARQSHSLAAAVLVIGVVPFAVAVWWSIVIPLTALLMLAIGLPHVARHGV